MITLATLRARELELQRKLNGLAKQRTDAADEHHTAVAALAEGSGTPEAVAQAHSKMSSLAAAIEVLGEQLQGLAGEITPLEMAAVRDRQLRQLRELADRVVAVHAEALVQRQEAAEQLAVFLKAVVGRAAGYGGRLRELTVLLRELDAAAAKLEEVPPGGSRIGHRALWNLLQLKADDRIHAAFSASLPGGNPFHRWVRPESLPDLGAPGELLDHMVANVVVVMPEESDVEAP